jgi:hypothetical protein
VPILEPAKIISYLRYLAALTNASSSYILMHMIEMRGHVPMRTTLNIEDTLIERASELTGIKEKTTLVKLGLEALIARESAARLAKLGGTERELKVAPRRRVTE